MTGNLRVCARQMEKKMRSSMPGTRTRKGQNRFLSPAGIDESSPREVDANGATGLPISPHASTAFHNRHLGYHIFRFELRWRHIANGCEPSNRFFVKIAATADGAVEFPMISPTRTLEFTSRREFRARARAAKLTQQQIF